MIHNIHFAAFEAESGVRIHAACTCGLFAAEAFGTVPGMAERFDRLDAVANGHRGSAIAAEERAHLLAQLAEAEADETAATQPARALHDLPIFGWAWAGDAADLGA